MPLLVLVLSINCLQLNWLQMNWLKLGCCAAAAGAFKRLAAIGLLRCRCEIDWLQLKLNCLEWGCCAAAAGGVK
jgi:hypothetical protein